MGHAITHAVSRWFQVITLSRPSGVKHSNLTDLYNNYNNNCGHLKTLQIQYNVKITGIFLRIIQYRSGCNKLLQNIGR
jgi:hypothetical protein